jgi:hypothetical protein
MKIVIATILFLHAAPALTQNVGIGTETPLQKLHVVGSAVITNNLGIGTTNPQSRLSVNGNAEVSGNTAINGNLAVGLPTAAYRLDVGGSARLNGDLFLNSSNAGGTWLYISNFSGTPTGWKMVATTDGKLKHFNTGNTSALTLLQNGRVGIGTETPAYPLEVVGDAAVTGNFAIGGVVDIGHVVTSTELTFQAGGINAYSIPCPAGTKIVSGGGGYPGFNPDLANDIITIYNGPDPDFPSTKWRLYMWNTNNVSVPIKVFCICARIY